MKKPKIICISAKARHGKDKFAEFAMLHLEEKYPELKTKRLGYGDWVKDICARHFNCTQERNDFNRTQWQQIGTNKGRYNHPEIWVNMTVDLVKGIFIDFDYIFISDCRFENEIQRWIDEGFDVASIRINRPDFDNGLTEEQKNHPSEISLDNYNFDHYIDNDETLYDYMKKIEKYIETNLI